MKWIAAMEHLTVWLFTYFILLLVFGGLHGVLALPLDGTTASTRFLRKQKNVLHFKTYSSFFYDQEWFILNDWFEAFKVVPNRYIKKRDYLASTVIR